MGKNVTIDDLLKDIRQSEKIAEEKKKETEMPKDEKKDSEVGTEIKKDNKEKEVEDATTHENKQKEDSPVDDAIKMATKLAALDKEVMVKEAELIGKAIIDGASSRVAELEKAASANISQEKIAHAYETDADFRESFNAGFMDKVASEIESDPEAVQAYKLGYHDKIAEDAHEDKVLKEAYDRGFMDKVAEEIESNPEAKKAFIEGYEKTASELIKVGQHYRDKAYVETADVLSRLELGRQS